jgi:putative ATP-dependent endonuclease of OLD family
MNITKIEVNNFRLLQNTTLDLEDQEEKDLSILIGRNNSGKTSFIMLFDRFLKNSSSFNFDDFPVSIRKSLFEINEGTDINKISIQLIIEITYSEKDNLENLSEFILDLDPTENKVHILFECFIDKKRLLNELVNVKPENKNRFIKKHLNEYLINKIYTFDNYDNLETKNRSKLIEKDKKSIERLINYQVIHAKRSVTSSESGENSKKALSTLTTSYFNKKTENQLSTDDLDNINASLLKMDETLEVKYEEFFDDFLNKSKAFLDMDEIRVVSNLESKEIISNHSKIVYGLEDSSLPEHLNGLGYMNILYLLLELEIKKEFLIEGKRDINLLFVEEPEAHTHPQMQSIFIEKVRALLLNIPHLQTFITTHSSHIVKNSNFKDIRYFHHDTKSRNVIVKNFYTELQHKYKDEKDEFKFLNQYLSIASAELFFAEKIIFIEGLTEKLLLPYFIKEFDKVDTNKIKLSSQNISIIEIGANAKAFSHFIEFLGIKALIITDIDTTLKTISKRKKKDSSDTIDVISYPSNPVQNSTHISNATIRHFYNSPKFEEEKEWNSWFEKLKIDGHHQEESKIKLAFQLKENNYHGRSFEESFISINVENIKINISEINGISSNAESELSTIKDFDLLTNSILKKKSEFASSLLWLALTKELSWNIPSYINKGLIWIAK